MMVKSKLKLGKKSVKNLVDFLGDLKTPKFHSETNQILNRFLSEAREEICQKFGWLFGRFEDNKISF